MRDHVVVCVDPLMDPPVVETRQAGGCSPSSSSEIVRSEAGFGKEKDGEEIVGAEEEEQLIQMMECRICQEEDHIKNLETPCACSGSLKYAHRDCVQRWCNEKGDITCEICHQAYKSGYTAPSRPPIDSTIIDIGAAWTITGTPVDLRDPRILAMASAQSRLLEEEYGEYDDSNSNPTAFCRFAALILMALLLLKHAISITTDEDEDDFSLFFMRAAGFLLPLYVMAWAMSSLHRRRRQRQEAAAMAAAEISFILQTGGRSLQFTLAPEPELPPHQPAYHLQRSSST